MFASIEPWRLRPVGERDLRRQLDLAVARAVVDPDYADRLLADPTLVLDGGGCTPQQHLQLREIRASSVRDFARQAVSLFWPTSDEAADLGARCASPSASSRGLEAASGAGANRRGL
jgi:hypothetical protein